MKTTTEETKFQTIIFQSQFEKVTVQMSIAELWTVISDQMNNYQLPHAQFDQTSDQKHNINLYGKLSTKLLAQAAKKSSKSILTKTEKLLFS